MGWPSGCVVKEGCTGEVDSGIFENLDNSRLLQLPMLCIVLISCSIESPGSSDCRMGESKGSTKSNKIIIMSLSSFTFYFEIICTYRKKLQK